MQALRNRLRSDRGSATLTTMVIGSMLIFLLLAFSLDVTKNFTVKNTQNSKAQEAVEVAVKKVDARGSLGDTPDGASAPASVTAMSAAYNSSTEADGVRGLFRSEACSTRTVTRWDGRKGVEKLPYIIVRLDTVRTSKNSMNAVTYVVSASGSAQRMAGPYNPKARYKVIQAEVIDAAPNLMMGMFGVPCQDLTSKVSAIAFGSQGDTN